jgi:hypothetical protein
MSFPARYPGRCVDCKERIHEGDPITMTDAGAVHEDCESIEGSVPPTENPVCTTCWLTHPQGSCDR